MMRLHTKDHSNTTSCTEAQNTVRNLQRRHGPARAWILKSWLEEAVMRVGVGVGAYKGNFHGVSTGTRSPP